MWTSGTNGTVFGSQGALRGPDSRPYVYTVQHYFLLQASHLAPCLVSTRRDDLSRNFFLGMVSDMLLVGNGP